VRGTQRSVMAKSLLHYLSRFTTEQIELILTALAAQRDWTSQIGLCSRQVLRAALIDALRKDA
jgi:hypothetical protein